MTEVKRITFQNSRDKMLVGHLYGVNSDSIVIMAPGFCSDKSSQGRFEVYARHLNEKGISALAIDFAGCGESDDELLTLENHVDDLKCATQFACQQGYTKLGLFGNSLGGLVCLKVYSPEIRTIVTLGGLSGPMDYSLDDLFTTQQIENIKHFNYVIENRLKQLYRKEVKIDLKMLEEVKHFQQQDLLQLVKCPVLLIHGDGDEEERSLYQLSRTGMPYLPSSSELKFIPGAAHGFWGYIDEVAELLTGWFEQHL